MSFQLHNKDDPNVSNIPVDHPFMSATTLEAEGMKLLESIITMLYTSQYVLHSFPWRLGYRDSTQKPGCHHCHRKQLESATQIPSAVGPIGRLFFIVLDPGCSCWPSALCSQECREEYQSVPHTRVQVSERLSSCARMLIHVLLRGPHGSAFGAQINKALTQQSQRMERALAEEKARKVAAAAAASEAAKKRPSSAPAEQVDPKRLKSEVDNATANSAAFLATFDFSTLPVALVIDLIIANLQAFPEPTLQNLVELYRQNRDLSSLSLAGPSQPTDSDFIAEDTPLANIPARPVESNVKDEPIDPLKMDIDEEEMEYEPDRLNLEVRISLIYD